MKDIDFSKTVVFTDLHLGLKNNSREHNTNCENFIKWTIEQAKAHDIKTAIFMGDFHHIRSSINISTLNYSVSGLKFLNDYFDNVIFLIGNHDFYFRDKLEIHSIPYINQFPNIHIIDKITKIGDCTFVPWLVGDEWKEAAKIRTPYVFGHFELPSFKMNALVEMADHGKLNKNHFKKQKQVFSGHFHKRQQYDNIYYIGNAFPHDYADAWDDDRGLMFWEPGKDPTFKSFPDAPKYRTLTLSQVLSNPAAYIDDRTYARVLIDIDITYEEANFMKELFEVELNAREITMTTKKLSDIEVDTSANINFESLDTIVISHLSSIESNTLDSNELIKIYQAL